MTNHNGRMKAAELLDLLQASAGPARKYWDKTNYSSYEEQQVALQESATVYVGNLSYYTSEQHVFELARQAGPIRKVIMGLHREKKTPCGFAFVEYFTRDAALDAESLLNGKTLESRVLKIEMDPGFKEGRQFGRGRGGGQVRDDFREEDDPERGGRGSLASAGLLPHMSGGGPGASTQFGASPAAMGASNYVAPNSAPSFSQARHGGYDDRSFKRGRYSRGGDRFEESRAPRGARQRSPDSRGGRYTDRGAYDRQQNQRRQQAPMVDEFGRDIAPPASGGDEVGEE